MRAMGFHCLRAATIVPATFTGIFRYVCVHAVPCGFPFGWPKNSYAASTITRSTAKMSRETRHSEPIEAWRRAGSSLVAGLPRMVCGDIVNCIWY